jgi:hypothetical protein
MRVSLYSCVVIRYGDRPFSLWPAWLYNNFPHYLINGTIFVKKIIEHKTCVLIFSATLSEMLLILRGIQRDAITNLRISSYEVPFILVKF